MEYVTRDQPPSLFLFRVSITRMDEDCHVVSFGVGSKALVEVGGGG